MENVTVGDWVTSYSKGYWQVYRVLTRFYETRYKKDSPRTQSDKVTIFSKRLVNEQFKRSFSQECCSSSFVNKLPSSEIKKILAFLDANKKIKSDFEKTLPKEIDLIVNISIGLSGVLDKSSAAEKLENEFREVASGFTNDRILDGLERIGLSQFVGKSPTSLTAQFVSLDHEVLDANFIFRRKSALLALAASGV